MSTPVPQRLAEELASRLEAILSVNGYSFDVSEVVRPNRDGDNFGFKHQSIRIDQGASERVEDLDCPGNPPALCWSQVFDIRCVTRNSNKADDEQDPEVDMPNQVNSGEMMAQAIKAITAETQWHTMNSISFDARFGSIETFQASDGEYNGQTIPLTCFYRVDENNPYNVRA